MAKIPYLLCLVALLNIGNAYKILVVFPMPGRSHNILGQGIVKHLLEAGHEVTYVTPFPTKKTTSKYHEVDISQMLGELDEKKFALQKILDKEVSVDLAGAFKRISSMATMSMRNKNLNDFLSDPTQEFDAVIAEWLFSDVYAGYATVYNCPLMWLSPVEPYSLTLRLMYEATNPAFNSDALTTAVPPFTFFQRMISLLRQTAVNALKYFYYDGVEKKFYEEFFGPKVALRGRELPPYEEVLFNSSFLFANSYPALSQPISMPPNVKEIGGYHVDPNPKPLPADLQKLMDEAKHGVIYFSMGSNAKSKDFPDVLKQDFLRVLGGLKQTVIWKFEEDLPNRPKNVHIVQWAPQTSILAHSNCRLFISHGGLLSTTETIFFGVPSIVMPYGADQHVNAIRAVQKGYALKVDMSYEMANDMKLAIDEMIGNPKYTERVKALSKLFNDRPVPPGKELVHWVEHVVRTRGAPHLRSPALMLPWYQKVYLDLAVVVLIILYALKKLFSKLRSLFSKKTPASQKKSN